MSESGQTKAALSTSSAVPFSLQSSFPYLESSVLFRPESGSLLRQPPSSYVQKCNPAIQTAQTVIRQRGQAPAPVRFGYPVPSFFTFSFRLLLSHRRRKSGEIEPPLQNKWRIFKKKKEAAQDIAALRCVKIILPTVL